MTGRGRITEDTTRYHAHLLGHLCYCRTCENCPARRRMLARRIRHARQLKREAAK